MADSILAQALVKYVATADDNVEPVYRQPFTVTVDGQVWSVAVTGPTLVAVKGKSSYFPHESNPEIKALLSLQADKYDEVDLHDLKAWCGNSEERDDAVVDGKVFNRTRLGQLLKPFPFPKAQMGTTWFHSTPALIVESPNKWRVVIGAVDCDPEPEMAVWQHTSQKQMFDLAMSLE